MDNLIKIVVDLMERFYSRFGMSLRMGLWIMREAKDLYGVKIVSGKV